MMKLDHKSPLEEKSVRCGGNRERLVPLQLVRIDGLRRRLLGVCLFVRWEKKRKGGRGVRQGRPGFWRISH